MRDRILSFLSERGTLADEQAVAYLLTQSDPTGAAERLLRLFSDPPMVITLEDIRTAVAIARAASERAPSPRPTAVPPAAPRPLGSIPASFRETVAPASDVAEDLRILK